MVVVVVVGGGGGGGYWAETTHQDRPKRPTLKPGRKDPAETTHGRSGQKPMFNECATSAFLRQGSDRYIGHWSLPPRRATEPIAASLILNIAISEPLLITYAESLGPDLVRQSV